MLAMLLLAALGQTAHAPAPADEWRPYTLNPAYEVRGHMQGGVFRYTESRPRPARKAPEPGFVALPAWETNGVTIDPSRLIEGSVRGTDNALAQSLAEKDRRFHLRAARHAGDVEQCPPGPGPCPTKPRPKPSPEPEPHRVPLVPVAVGLDRTLIVAAVFLAAIVVGLVLVLVLITLFAVARLVFRLIFPPTSV